MSKNKEYRLLGVCKYCGQEVFGTHPNKFQAHQRFCKENPNRNKALNQIKIAGIKGGKISNVNRSVKTKILNEKHSHKFICKKCNCEYELWLTDRDFERGNYPKYCSSKCSHSRNHSEETKRKISNSVKNEHIHKCPICGKEFLHIGTGGNTFCDECFREQYNRDRGFFIANKKIKMEKYQRWSKLGNDVPLHQTTCKSCNKTFWCKTSDDVYCYDCAKKLGKVVHQLYTKTGKKIVSNETRKKLSQCVQQRIKNGTHNGWSTRNTRSFPEIFWEGVLKNNSISFISEKYIKEYGYFLDFYIELSNGLIINLEIDGKQHTYEDRILHDKKRDKRLRNLGYLVYRIPWNEISSNIGKSKIKAKINQFLWWFNQIRKINT